MAKKVGLISINLLAGTAKFNADMESAKAKIRSLNGEIETAQHKMVSGNQAASAAIRVVENGMANNLRAVENFLSKTLGLGPVLQAIFPVVGAIAFTGLMVHLGEELYKFVKSITDLPAKSANAFRGLNQGVRTSSDELQLANDRLMQDINKLEGRHENGFKIALDEVIVSADKLAHSLEEDFKQLEKLLKETELGAIKAFLSDQTKTTGIHDRLFGKSGFEGPLGAEIPEKLQKALDDLEPLQVKFDAAKTDQEKKAILAAANAIRASARTELDASMQKLITESDTKLAEARRLQAAHEGKNQAPSYQAYVQNPGMYAPWGEQAKGGNEKLLIAQEAATNRQLREYRTALGRQFQNAELQQRKSDDEAKNQNARLDRPFANKMADIQAEVQASANELAVVGKSEQVKEMALAAGEAAKAIEQVNKALEALHAAPLKPGGPEEQLIRQAEAAKVAEKSEVTWRTKITETSAALQDRIQSQRLLTAAVDQGYEATKRATVLYETAKAVGFEKYNDPAFVASHQGYIQDIQSKLTAEYDEKNATRQKEALKTINEHIALEEKLASVEAEGAEAVRRATLAMEIQNIVRYAAKESVVELVLAKQREYAAARLNVNAIERKSIKDQIDDNARLASAEIAGAEAVRRARLEVKYDRMREQGSTNIEAERQKDLLAHLNEINTVVAQAANADRDRLYVLDQSLKAAILLKGSGVDELGLRIQIRDIENQILDIQVRQALQIGSLREGFKAFFLEMEKEAEKPGKILYDGMHRALNGLEDNLTRIMTGQKSAWADMFKNVGRNMVHDSISAGLHAGLGAIAKTGLGKRLGLDKLTVARKDGQTPATALMVQVVQGEAGSGTGSMDKVAGVGAAAGGGIWATMGNIIGQIIAGVGGAGGGGTSVSSKISYRAAGGDVSASESYVVGEEGPEILRRTSGRVISNAESRKLLGGSGNTYHVAIDARGTDPVLTEQRTYRAMIAAHNSAVGTAVRASVERGKRVPTAA